MSLCHSISDQWGVVRCARIANGNQALLSGSLESRSPVQVMDSSDVQSDSRRCDFTHSNLSILAALRCSSVVVNEFRTL